MDRSYRGRIQLSEVFVVNSFETPFVCFFMVCQYPIAQYFLAQRPAVPAPAIDWIIVAGTPAKSWGNLPSRPHLKMLLRRHIRTQYAVPASITTAQRPSWWLPGNGICGPAAVDAAMVPSVETLG